MHLLHFNEDRYTVLSSCLLLPQQVLRLVKEQDQIFLSSSMQSTCCLDAEVLEEKQFKFTSQPH